MGRKGCIPLIPMVWIGYDLQAIASEQETADQSQLEYKIDVSDKRIDKLFKVLNYTYSKMGLR